jgi:aspartyl protease family protein
MRELPTTLKIATVWLVLATLVFLGVQAWQQHEAKTRFQVVEGGTGQGRQVVLQRAPDGHYHWPGRLNGVAVDFLIDTGATNTAISRDLAEQAGLSLGERFVSQTANGAVTGHRARATLELAGGLRVDQLEVGVLPALSTKPLLGMNVLGRLKMQQDAGRLTITLP